MYGVPKTGDNLLISEPEALSLDFNTKKTNEKKVESAADNQTESEPSATTEVTEVEPSATTEVTEVEPSATTEATESEPSATTEAQEVEPSATTEAQEGEPSTTTEATESEPSHSTKDQKFGPNKAVPPPIDLTNRFYEISANTTYKVEPFVDLSAVPLLASVPGIGSTATLSAKIKRCAEFPQGLVRGPGAQNSGPSAAMQPALPPSFASPALADGKTDEPWNRPQIYEEIAAAGLTVVGHTVVLVDSQNGLWTDTGLTVNPSQVVWLDFRADGRWGPVGESLTADGYQILDSSVSTTFQKHNLVGSVAPPLPYITTGGMNDFPVGSRLYRYLPTGTGPLKLGYNDCGFAQTQAEIEAMYRENNRGVMTVRIIVTQ